MSTKFLKKDFVIHGGGLDLVFPHHENEIAQTESAGELSAEYWMHNGLLTINGQKMSKSLGNYVTLKDFIAKYGDPDLLKLLFLASHYRHPVDYTDEKIIEMAKMKERIVAFIRRAGGSSAADSGDNEYELSFIEAMDDDMNTPKALADIFELVTVGNTAFDKGDMATVSKVYRCLAKVLPGIFGLSLEDRSAGISDEDRALIEKRSEAKKKKDFMAADSIRKQLWERGIILEDTKDGTVWRKKI
jgi:cysteinyl-tRNA synthetase